LGGFLGMAVGLVLPQIPVVSQILEPYLFTLNGIPVIVIAPLFILWLGIGLVSKVGISIYIVFFAMFIPVYTNALRLEKEYLDLLYVMGASPWQRFWKVVVPSSMPSVYTGLKFGTGLSLIGAVIGEFVSSRAGLGHMILYASGTLDTPSLYLGILILAAFAAAMTTLANLVGRLIVRWRYADEK
jgi:NitT/TauT family transport system permease protein